MGSTANCGSTRPHSTRDGIVVEWEVVPAECRRKNRSQLNNGCKSEVVISYVRMAERGTYLSRLSGQAMSVQLAEVKLELKTSF